MSQYETDARFMADLRAYLKRNLDANYYTDSNDDYADENGHDADIREMRLDDDGTIYFRVLFPDWAEILGFEAKIEAEALRHVDEPASSPVDWLD